MLSQVGAFEMLAFICTIAALLGGLLCEIRRPTAAESEPTNQRETQAPRDRDR